MPETFTKLFSSITSSTIWGEDSDTRVIWVTMLAMADQYGYVGASIPGLARQAVVPVEVVEKAIAKFLAPDPHSRSQEHEGRRIEVADRGWTLLNYGRFRDMRDEEVRREYERNRKRAQRKTVSRNVPDKLGQSRNVPDVPKCPAVSAQAEAEAEAELTTSSDFEAVWRAYPKRPNNPKAKARRAWQARIAAGVDPAVMAEGVARYAAYVRAEKKPPEFVMHASTFFGPDLRFQDDYTIETPNQEHEVYAANGTDFNPEFLKALGVRPPQ